MKLITARPDRCGGSTVILSGVQDDAPMTPRLARRAFATAGFHPGLYGDRDKTYRVSLKTTRLVRQD